MEDEDAGAQAGFRAATGAAGPPGGTSRERAAGVTAALDDLLQIRRLVNTQAPDPAAVPAPWERTRPVRAVALGLEAAGIPPSAVGPDARRTATGYCVTAAGPPGTVRVDWLGPHGSGAAYEGAKALARCAEALRRLGWVALEYRGPRRQWYLHVEPPA